MCKVGETEMIYELYVSGLPWLPVALQKTSWLNGGQLMRALKGRLKYLSFNWTHYWSLNKGVTDDDRDLRKSFLLGTHMVGWEEGLGVRRLLLP